MFPADSSLRLASGAVLIGLSALMSLLLALDHLVGLSLPGCGEGGACQQAANSFWGKIRLGGFEWPVSYLGTAYFLSMLAAWIAVRGAAPPIMRYIVRLGALVSLGFCVIVLVERVFCSYCIAAHIGNFAFWMTVESTRAPTARPRRAVTTIATVFALVTLALSVWDRQTRAALRESAERERNVVAHEIIAGAQPQPTPSVSEQAPATEPEPRPPFTGRYRMGPAEAPIRIVMFTDYQCQDCYNLEQQLQELHETRNDISISVKHFPFNSDCNPEVSRTIHRNACWAARAAEAAGALWGPEGFWKMHVWLFERRGVFKTTAELEEGIRQMGYDPAGFVKAMSSEDTLQAIRGDALEAKQLGLYFTPMIFINGVEMRGWTAPGALIRTVEQVAATNPPSRSAAFDRPPLAFEKHVADWRAQPKISLPPDPDPWVLGPTTATVKIVMWGDLQEPWTGQADAIIRAFVARHGDAQYTYRHYPFNSDCNPNVKDRRHPDACRAAMAAEAAGRLAGNDGYWKMHAWLMENQQRFSDEALRAAATEMGIDSDALLAAMAQDDVQTHILQDLRAGKQLPQLRHGMPRGIYGVPTIFVNDRYVPRWRIEDQPVLNAILEDAE